jgi:hypothetical protein
LQFQWTLCASVKPECTGSAGSTKKASARMAMAITTGKEVMNCNIVTSLRLNRWVFTIWSSYGFKG